MASRQFHRGLLGLVLLGSACSSLAEIPKAEECTESSCAEGFVCHQGRCLSNDEAAPRAHLGFDIRERAAGRDRFRVEVDGCDCTVEESFRELAVRRSRVSQKLFLSAATPLEPPDDVLTARFELTQPSRFGEFPAPQIGSVDHPQMNEEANTELRWPRYHPLDQDVPPDLIMWKIEPVGELALRYLALEPPRTDEMTMCTVDSDCCEPRGECNPAPNFCDTSVGQCSAVGQPEWAYHHVYQPDCSRTIEGNAVPIDMETFTVLDDDPTKALPDASVTMRYADSTADGPFGVHVFDEVPPSARPPECEDDDDCDAPVEFCHLESQQCFVSLAGFPANRDTTTGPQGLFTTQVYTYCDLENDDGLDRTYEVTVGAPGAHPKVNYLLDANFSPLAEPGTKFVAGQFCVPDWGEGVPLELEFIGQPRTLISGDVEYTCCDVGCLPATADDVEAPSSVPVRCDGRTDAGARPEVEVESYFVLEDVQPWLDADCVAPNPDPLGRVGSLSQRATCTTADAPCLVEDIALGTAESPRRYSVRIVSQVGSVVASGDFTVELSADVPEVQTLPLTPRVLVTGTVDVDTEVCALREGNDCAAREAIVLAERIRMPDEPEGSVPGPYFHSVSTYYDPVAQRDGAFVLPLDPGGVYVLTALPPPGAEGGPSRFQVVNLRSDADTELQPLHFVLDDGIVVTVRLDQFDQRTEVIPMDRGSFLADGHTLVHPARAGTADPFIDLNRLGECWTPLVEGDRGCQIRRLIPPGSGLARSQVDVVRFTARRSDGTECTNVCPQPDPAE